MVAHNALIQISDDEWSKVLIDVWIFDEANKHVPELVLIANSMAHK